MRLVVALLIAVTTVGGTAGCGDKPLTPPANPVQQSDDKVKERHRVANQFLAAVRVGDWEKAAGLSEVPFLVGGWQDSTRVKDRAELPSRLAAALPAVGGAEAVAKDAFLLSALRSDEAPPELAHEVRNRWKDVGARWIGVAGSDGWLVHVGEATAPSPVKLLIRMQGGSPRVVGLLNVLSVNFANPDVGAPTP